MNLIPDSLSQGRKIGLPPPGLGKARARLQPPGSFLPGPALLPPVANLSRPLQLTLAPVVQLPLSAAVPHPAAAHFVRHLPVAGRLSDDLASAALLQAPSLRSGKAAVGASA
jgi:hypothetical protein